MTNFLKKLRGLNFVFRWNYHPRIRQENVAEHSFWVSVFSVCLARKLQLDFNTSNSIGILALFHDAEEAVTGDLPALVKRYTTDWSSVERIAEKELYDTAPELALYAHAHNVMLPEWKVLIKLADFFAALMYVKEEIDLGNNKFGEIRGELIGCILKASSHNSALEKVCEDLLVGLGFNLHFARPVQEAISHL